MSFLSKDVFFDLLMYVFQVPFDYLVLDRDNNEYFRRWKKIEIYNKQDADKTTPKEKQLRPRKTNVKQKNSNVTNTDCVH